MRQEVTTKYGQGGGGPAGFWIRFAAYVIDGILLGTVEWLLLLASGLDAIPDDPDVAMSGPIIAFQLLMLAIWLLYYAFFEASKLQATPGKLAVAIKVTDSDGETRLGNDVE